RPDRDLREQHHHREQQRQHENHLDGQRAVVFRPAARGGGRAAGAPSPGAGTARVWSLPPGTAAARTRPAGGHRTAAGTPASILDRSGMGCHESPAI
ncbi:hypothetical protein, partial [Frankia sp. AvcI1]|uniref:hypothetical protein n=1 Tax=Frankia sp. AvcI1 TaxID=573496 RepID=UPI002117F753